MSWAAVATAVGSAASAGIGLAGSNKAGKEAAKAGKAASESAAAMERIRDQLIGGNLFGRSSGDFAGKRPEFADFQRLNLGEGLASQTQEQLTALPDIAALVSGVNAAQTLDDAVRFERLVPGGLDALRTQGQTAASLSRGELPFEDALGIVRDRAGLSNSLGLGGTQFASAVPRDLGLSRLQAIQSGSSLAAQAANTANMISPQANRASVREQTLTGAQGLDFTNRQNLLQQQSLQNRFNLEASPDPLAQALLSLDLQRLNLRTSGQMAASQLGASTALSQARIGQEAISGLGDTFSSIFANRQQQTDPRSDLIGSLTGAVANNPSYYNPF